MRRKFTNFVIISMSMTALRSTKIKKYSLICMPNYKIPICLSVLFSFFYDNVIAIRCASSN